jgi:hypothetical protein
MNQLFTFDTSLFHENHLARGREVPGCQAVKVDPTGHVLTQIVPAIPGDSVKTGCLRLIDQGSDFLSQEIEDFQSDV